MFHEPSFWVAIAFVIFAFLVFRPVFRKTKIFLEEYRLQINSEIRALEDYVQEAKLSLARAQDVSKTTQKQIEEIRQNTDMQIVRIQKELKEELDLLSENQKKQLSSHRDFLNDKAKKELRNFLLTEALREVTEILSQTPRGISPSFQEALQKTVNKQ